MYRVWSLNLGCIRKAAHLGCYVLLITSRCQKFDYGSVAENIKFYGQPTPPEYPVSALKVPTALFYSDNDWLATPKDVARMYFSLASNFSFTIKKNVNFQLFLKPFHLKIFPFFNYFLITKKNLLIKKLKTKIFNGVIFFYRFCIIIHANFQVEKLSKKFILIINSKSLLIIRCDTLFTVYFVLSD